MAVDTKRKVLRANEDLYKNAVEVKLNREQLTVD